MGNSDPTGTSPESITKTYVSALEIYKYETENGTKKALPGATFKVTGTDVLNFVKVTGETYIKKSEFDAAAAGTYTRVGTDVYYKLLDDNYTTTVAGSQAADYTATATSNDQGLIEFKGLNAGTYTIEETIAPDGYNKIEGTSTLVIAWTDPAAIEAIDESERTDEQKAQLANGGFYLSGTEAGKFTITTSSDGDNVATVHFEIENNKGTNLPSTGGIGTTIFYMIGAILVIGSGIVLVTRRRMSAN